MKQSLEYILTYPEFFENMDTQKEEMSAISIMQSKSALFNADKTEKDYADIRDSSLKTGMDDSITSFVSFPLTLYLILFFISMTIYGGWMGRFRQNESTALAQRFIPYDCDTVLYCEGLHCLSQDYRVISGVMKYMGIKQ